MGIFDIFGNSDASNAANAQIQGLESGYNQLVPLLNQGTSTLQNYYGQGQNALTGNAGNATGALNSNYGAASGALTSNAGNAIGALNQNYAAALQPYTNNYNAGAAGQTQLGNLLGLNGAAGSASAQNTLQNLPGYQFALNQGTQNVLRNQSATGQLNSGATNTALTNYSQGLASQNYNNYVNELQPYLNASNAAAGGIANVNTGLGSTLANTYTGLGQNLANVNTGLGTNLANTYNTLGQNLNSNLTGLGQGINTNLNTQGQAAYGTQVGIGNAQANQYMTQLAQSGALFGGLTSLAGNLFGAGKSGGTGGTASNGLASGLGSGLSSIGSGLGSGLSSVGSGIGSLLGIFSDERLKEKMTPIGKLDSGLTIYRFRYKGSKTRRYGIMAQELERCMPQAVRTNSRGFKYVDKRVVSQALRSYANGRRALG